MSTAHSSQSCAGSEELLRLGAQFPLAVFVMLSTTLLVGATVDGALAWIYSAAGQDAIRIVQSVQVN